MSKGPVARAGDGAIRRPARLVIPAPTPRLAPALTMRRREPLFSPRTAIHHPDGREADPCAEAGVATPHRTRVAASLRRGAG